MHLLALTAGAALVTIAPATAPPGVPTAGPLPAGTYTIEVFNEPFTLTLPEGWRYEPEFNVFWAFDDTAYIIPGMFTEVSGGVVVEPTNQVPADNCAWRDSDATTAETAAELAAAMGEQRGSLVSAPEPLQIGPYSGVVFTAAPVPATDCDDGHQMVFMDSTPDGWWYHGDGIHDVKTILALDLPAGLDVIEVGTYVPLLPADQRELLDVIESIEFEDPD